MIQRIRKSRIVRLVCFYLSVFIFTNGFFPGETKANGPSQSEFSGGSDAGNMVDPFTGDFKQSIPLMQVPGPGGSFPIELNYSSSGINMETDAGWVGLGWSMNTGSINRSMKGLPDDYKGDVVTKNFNLKDMTHVSLSQNISIGPEDKEIFGLNFLILSFNSEIYSNSYTGVGFGFGVGFTASMSKKFFSHNAGKFSVAGSLSLNYDSQKGCRFSESVGFTNYFLDVNRGINHTSRIGVQSYASASRLFSGFKSFDKVRYIPGQTLPISGKYFTAFLQYGDEDNNYKYSTLIYNVFVGSQKLKTKTEEIPAYGYLYSESANDGLVLMDFNRENDVPVNEQIPAIANPVFLADDYTITGDMNANFRAFRSDIGVLRSEDRTNNSGSTSGGMEIAPGTTDAKIGFDLTDLFTSSYSGNWQASGTQVTAMDFQSKRSGELYEPYYFKVTSEITESDKDFLEDIKGYTPVKFDISMQGGEPFARNHVSGTSPYGIQNNGRLKREVRELNIEPFTVSEITANEKWAGRTDHMWSAGQNPVSHPSGGAAYSYPAEAEDHHIGAISTVSSNGTKHTYGIPVYVKTHTEQYFASTNESSTQYGNQAQIAIDADDPDDGNEAGMDHLYFENSLASYTTAHLLTGITSHDYVDLTSDGISNDDLGFFVKLNYTRKYEDFKWRTPYQDAYYHKEYYSNDADDRASFTYGTKEVIYTNSIETKTHIAVFILGNREDAVEPPGGRLNDEAGTDDNAGRKLQKIEKIILYSKADLSTPIQTVDFLYDYSLCVGWEPNSGITGTADDGNQGGKLTLLSVTITNLDNDKGTTTPYTFTYSTTNPGYESLKFDRWGITNGGTPYADIDWDHLKNPYQHQGDYDRDGDVDASDATQLNTDVSAWLLKKITMPAKGEIEVTYESDDYGYVQDKRATQMMRIVGTSDIDDTDKEADADGHLRQDDLHIYFQLEHPIDGGASSGEIDTEILKYIEGMDRVYFKTYQKLKLVSDPDDGLVRSYDYVEGYAEIDRTSSSNYGVDLTQTNGAGKYTTGYITVKTVNFDNVAGTSVAHPFRMAGWQYIRLDRPDLTSSPVTNYNSAVTQYFASLLSIVPNLGQLYGYYNFAALGGFSNRMLLIEEGPFTPKPSYLKLNSPDYCKTGGGHRVSQITWKDKWGEFEQTLGQTYEYVTEDGKSSGVASQEPSVGTEESALRIPQFYPNDLNITYKDQMAYLEQPYNESYFPSAHVGYSRVVIKNIQDADVNINQQGVTVQEFYTAKDFPTISTATGLSYVGENDFDLQLFGSNTIAFNGYSQGFYCETNDMHGKLKAVSTYKHGTDFMAAPVSKTEYVYHTDAQGRLKNEVTALRGDAWTETVTMGENYEFFVDMREHYDIAESLGAEANVDISNNIPIPSLWPKFVTDESMFRSVAANKIVHKNGILKKVITHHQGATATAENLMFDTETGNVLLSSVTNTFEKPVYNYTYAAHWSYPGMRGAYKNWGLTVDNKTAASGVISITDAHLYFYPGDELQVLDGSANIGKIYYVTDVTTTNITIEDIDGANPSFSTYDLKVIRSGNRNLQGMPSGEIVALKNPVTERSNLLLMYNNTVTGETLGDPTAATIEDYYDCDGDVRAGAVSVDINFDDAGLLFDMNSIPSIGCALNCDLSAYDEDLADFRFLTFASTGTVQILHVPTNTIITATWEGNCFDDCFDVLHASATEYQEDGWTYNYKDAGDPEIATSTPLRTATVNDYRYGKRGIWRSLRSNVYQTDRKQTGSASTFLTKINLDGEYKKFDAFNWILPVYTEWNWAQKITKYNPYGMALEMQDRLELFASTMFGYNNSAKTATAANCSYYEMGFDAFEDYESDTYVSNEGHGHFNFKDASDAVITLSSDTAHTGKISARLETKIRYTCTVDNGSPDYFTPKTGKKYLVSAWFKTDDIADDPTIVITNVTTTSTITADVTYNDYPFIEGWKKMEVVFTAPSSSHNVRIEFGFTNSGTGFIDDVRMHPFEGAITTAVFDPLTLWKIADLDNQNFATFYNYDEEGNVVQVKKETTNGVVTISTGRSNIKQQ